MISYNRILKLRPNVNPDDFGLGDDSQGEGVYIYRWDSNESIPTTAEFDSVDDTAPLFIVWAELRRERDQLLNNTDWWASTDLSITEAQTSYRQALRDLPANTADARPPAHRADPTNITWPEKP